MIGRKGHPNADFRRFDRTHFAIQTMDLSHRAIFERVRFQGMDHSRIANELRLTIDEVEQGFALALAHIDRVCERDP